MWENYLIVERKQRPNNTATSDKYPDELTQQKNSIII
jgi:hypothetical protein